MKVINNHLMSLGRLGKKGGREEDRSYVKQMQQLLVHSDQQEKSFINFDNLELTH